MSATETYYERRIATLNTAIQRVLAMHAQGDNGWSEWCNECGYRWPCPTVKALDGP